MGRKKQQEGRFSAGGWTRRHFFSEEDFRFLEACLRLDVSPPEFRSEIESATINYLDNQDYVPRMPRISDVGAAIRKIRELSKALLDLLNNLDDRTFEVLALTSAYKDSASIMELCENNRFDLEKIYSAAEEVLQTTEPDKGGNLGDVALKSLIVGLAKTFEKYTRKRPSVTFDPYTDEYRGIFFHFVETCLKIVEPEVVRENHALGKQIQKTLKDYRLRRKRAAT